MTFYDFEYYWCFRIDVGLGSRDTLQDVLSVFA